ncbi:MAG: hypothetical protein HY673_12695 [Chloroflexi bacterium]|nr:hypothetical protein [Chloroflexota bacterium]
MRLLLSTPAPRDRSRNSPGASLIKYLLWILVALATSDGIVTKFLIGSGAAREGNPLLAPLVGETVFVPVKVIGSLACALLFWDAYKKHPRVSFAATSSFVVIYAAIVVWNVSLFFIPRT